MVNHKDTIYAVCLPNERVRYTSQSQIVPIMGGAYALTKEQRKNLREEGYVFDDEGAFLSSLNNRWGELSCVHWMILNAHDTFIGNAQYRRGWVEPNDEWYSPDALYVPDPATFSCSLEQQFYGGHSAFDAPAITREFADTGKWLFSREEIDQVWAQSSFIGCNMARGSKSDYKRFMTVLFTGLVPIWEKHKELFLSIEGYDKRAIAFIAERLITGMVLYRDRILPGMQIKTAPISFIS
jgi:hypothetical protein